MTEIEDDAGGRPWPAPRTGSIMQASSSHAVECLPTVVWDVRGYYRSLGLSTDCSRTDIARAHVRASNTGGDPAWLAWLTFCARQLLDPDVRLAYDCVPLGGEFFDAWERERQRMIQRDALARTGQGVVVDEDEEFEEVQVAQSVEDRVREGTHLEPDLHPQSQWGVYCRGPVETEDITVFVVIHEHSWRAAVARALWQRGAVTRFGVGVDAGRGGVFKGHQGAVFLWPRYREDGHDDLAESLVAGVDGSGRSEAQGRTKQCRM